MNELPSEPTRKSMRFSIHLALEFERRIKRAITGKLSSILPRQATRYSGDELDLLTDEYYSLKMKYRVNLSDTPFIYIFLQNEAPETLGFWIADRIYSATIFGISTLLVSRPRAEIKETIRYLLAFQIADQSFRDRGLSARELQTTQEFAIACKTLEMEQLTTDIRYLLPEPLFTVASKKTVKRLKSLNRGPSHD